MNFCPCLESIRKWLPKKPKVKHIEAEQQEFINHQDDLVEEVTPPKPKSKPISKTHIVKEQVRIPIQLQEEHSSSLDHDLLDVKMELTPSQQNTTVVPTRDIQDLIKEELQMTPQQAVSQRVFESQEKRQRQQIEDLIETHTYPGFTINLDPIDPFYAILHEKTSNIEDYFSKQGQSLEIGFPNESNLQIEMIDNNKASTFIAKYSLKCSFSFYLSLLKNDKVLTSLTPFIGQLKVIESYRPNLTRNTIKFKRLGAFEPRDCFYVKYNNSGKGQHWQVYIHDQKAVPSPLYKTCELFCIKNIKQTNQGQLNISEYIEIDLQSPNIGSILPKLATEYRNYLNNLQKHIESNYEAETA